MEPIRLCKVIKNIEQNKALCGSWPPHPHRVSAFRSFQPELPVTARPSRSRQKQTIDPGTGHRFTPNIGTDHIGTDHYGWNGEAFPCCIVSISWHLVFCIPHNQHIHLWVLCTFLKNDRKTQSLGAFWLLSLCYYIFHEWYDELLLSKSI